MPRVIQRAAARNDLLDYFVYLAEKAGLDTVDRFLASAELTFNNLAERPMLGTALVSQRPEIAGLRKWRVRDFENVLIFYQPHMEGVSIVRVIHATRDWPRLLDTEA
jgi:toxin ParE1/3/4